MSAWLLMLAAITVEVGATTALKAASASTSHPAWTLAALAAVVVSYLLMNLALRLGMQASIAYALWSGVGTAAIALIGASWFGESLNPVKIGALVLIVAGVVMLNLAPATTATAELPARPYTPPAVVVLAHLRLAEALADLDTAIGSLRRASHLLPGDPTAAPTAARARRAA
ncbi:DMT family transporter [Nonomuraea sp. NPDC050536]|uniref:DMT family transporter n=1 Tax=Nonomuraea sp. NPDC050536 TaxID=3364366 RepID=UPI0037CA5442